MNTSIEDFKEKIKLKAEDFIFVNEDKPQKVFKLSDGLFIVIVIILVAVGSFELGKISALEKKKIPIAVHKKSEQMTEKIEAMNNGSVMTNAQKDAYVASKTGTRYYYPWCSGAEKIKAENKIWFATVEEARRRGLTPASNCPGLE